MIKLFSIKELHGYKNISVSFESNFKVVVADNGAGKTTILNFMYFFLSGNFKELKRFNFNEVFVKFSNDTKVTVRREDLFGVNISSDFIKRLKYMFPEIKKLRDEELHKAIYNFNVFDDSSHVNYFPPKDVFNSHSKFDEFRRVVKKFATHSHMDLFEFENSKSLRSKDIIMENFKCDILYLPTYRRVEHKDAVGEYYSNDKRNIIRRGRPGSDGADFKLIQFGMTDVEDTFVKIRNTLTDMAINQYSKLSGGFLNSLVSEIGNGPTRDFSKSDLDIVLERVGENINYDTRSKIKKMVENDDILKSENKYLLGFINGLVSIYNVQKTTDDAVERFVSVVNKYLTKKKFKYDKGTVGISVFSYENRTEDGTEITLEDLSSGEKQIVSLFSKLYLENKQYAVLYDEPEISLSIEWQRQLLPDLIASGNCVFLLAATHSPFIFDNDLSSSTGIIESDYER